MKLANLRGLNPYYRNVPSNQVYNSYHDDYNCYDFVLFCQKISNLWRKFCDVSYPIFDQVEGAGKEREQEVVCQETVKLWLDFWFFGFLPNAKHFSAGLTMIVQPLE